MDQRERIEGMDCLKRARRMLPEIKSLVRTWAGSMPVAEIHNDPAIVRSLELVEQGVRLVEAGLGGGTTA